MIRMFSSGLVFGALAACATAPVLPEEGVGVEAETGDGAQVTSLPAQKLAPNECGLFLWSKTDASRFVFFAKAGAREALFLLDGLPTDLRPVSESGQIFGQFYTQTEYVTEAGRGVSLSYAPGEVLTDGARISDGTIQFTDGAGWRTVLPVLGVRACQPAQAVPVAGGVSPDDER